MKTARAAGWSPWLAGLFGAAMTWWLFHPGYMSWDSAYQWWQVRHGIFDPVSPPIMVGIWNVTNALRPGPGGYFLLQTLVGWAGVAAFAASLRLGPVWRVASVLILGFWPPVWAVSAHIWKDAMMLSWFVLAVACLCQDLRSPSRRLRLLALLFVALGAAYRYNAISAALPLCLWLGWREAVAWRGSSASRALAAAYGVAMLIVVALAAATPGLLTNKASGPNWPVIAQWDIAAVSIAEDRNLFPPRWTDPTLTAGDLRGMFDPSVNTLNVSSRMTTVFTTKMSDADLAALRRTWLSLPLAYPRPYAAHRLRMASLLFGWDQAAHPDYLVLQQGMVPYDDNPLVPANASRWHEPVQARLQSWIDTPWFAGWIYGAFAIFVLVAAAFDRRRPGAGLAMTIAASGLLLALPLVVLSPSTEFRYLNWLLMAALLAPMAWFFVRPDKR